MRSIILIIGLSSFIYSDFSRFNGVVLDNITKLEWQDEYEDNKIKNATWINAVTYCEDLILNNKSDWRLPNINELLSLVDDTKYNPSINTIFKYITLNDFYWSSTNTNNQAWYVSFIDGQSQETSKTYDDFYIRCVRSSN